MTTPTIPWWQQPVRMLRVDFTPHFSSVLNEDLEQLARSHKDQWQINCEWIVGSLSVDGKAYQTTFAAEGYERCRGFENFDFLRTYTPIAHKHGIHVLSYLNMHWYDYSFGDRHPDWEQIQSDGRPYGRINPLYRGGTTLCVNSPWRQWAFGLIREAMKTGIDGVFLDGPLIYPDCCSCPSCRRQFKNKFGQDIPKENWQDPLWRDFLEFREDSLARFLADAQQAVRQANPEGVIFLNAGSWSPATWRCGIDNQKLAPFQTFNGAESFFHYAYAANLYDTLMTGKFLRASDNPAVVFTHYMNGAWHYLNLPAGEVQLALVQTMASGTNGWLAFMQPSLTSQPESYRPVQELWSFQDTHQEYFKQTQSVAQVAILFSKRTGRNYVSALENIYEQLGPGKEQNLIVGQKGEKIIDWQARKSLCEELVALAYKGYFHILTQEHVLFDILLDGQLTDEKLAKYKTVVLPDVACLSCSDAEALKRFVQQGGTLLASFEAGFYDEKGAFTDQLFDLLGIEKVEGVFPVMMGENYSQFIQSALNWKEETRIERGPYALKVQPRTDVQTPAVFHEPILSFYAPLTSLSKHPAMLIQSFGQGKVIYYPEAIGHFYAKTGMISCRQRMIQAIEYLRGTSLVELDAPTSVSMEVFRQPSRLLIHLINNSVDGRPVCQFFPVQDIQLMLHIGTKPRRIFALRENKNLNISISEECVTIKNIGLVLYDIVVVEY
jgi:hypothetical protein